LAVRVKQGGQPEQNTRNFLELRGVYTSEPKDVPWGT